MKIRMPDSIVLSTEEGISAPDAQKAVMGDACAWAELKKGSVSLYVTADKSRPRVIRARWNFTESEMRHDPVRILGDEWERSYGEMEWRGIVARRTMPWVCIVSNGSDANPDYQGRRTECFGVKTRASSMCMWQYDGSGITLFADVRCGGNGVLLQGRVLNACTVLFGEYENTSAFCAAHQFYGTLNDVCLVPDHKVYGSNNWYYAYGVSSREDIIRDAQLVSHLCAGLENRPYMVIDDGWQLSRCNSPWEIGNERFPHMETLADEMRAQGVRPGIWIRYLADKDRLRSDVSVSFLMERSSDVIDPSLPEVLDLVRRDTDRIVNKWGFELIKHDFSTFDAIGFWGSKRKDCLFAENGWAFRDQTKTTAEIIVNLYQTIREAAGEKTVLIGCNVIGHLAAGLVHLNRIGDDTSGRNWESTRFNGINTLAFHMLHDKTFFAADADCVGVMGAYPFNPHNREWLKILSMSGTPLFASLKPGILPDEDLKAFSEAYARASIQSDVLEPVDWMENTCPTRWLVNGEEVTFNWNPENGLDTVKM